VAGPVSEARLEVENLTRRLRTDAHPLWARIRVLLCERGLDPREVAVAFGYDAGETEARIGLVHRIPALDEQFVSAIITVAWVRSHVDEATFSGWQPMPDQSPSHRDWSDHFAHARAVLIERREQVAQLRRARDEVKRAHGAFYHEALAILCRHDPMGLIAPGNDDEYDPEAATIVPRLAEATSADDVKRIIREEFSRWFHPDIVDPEERYEAPAQELWAAWRRRLEAP
jgi:hypothetical protein